MTLAVAVRCAIFNWLHVHRQLSFSREFSISELSYGLSLDSVNAPSSVGRTWLHLNHLIRFDPEVRQQENTIKI